ncbi:universal stress protein [Leeuwenhoekiella sp. MAR_2009_132]|uniref:universal stress protein n=1 Tax=Leeuwenhoekiella sp. MAR_2009_132 TaxID=1392489 RepID=UPI00048C838F|nr:universal stress protein [Leeuwenhoekiella sp. MAR_2009_132]
MRKILIPTDFSENALNAAKYTLELFKFFTCELYFVHAFAEKAYASIESNENLTFDEHKDAFKRKSDTQLKEFKSVLVTHFHNPKHEIHVLSVFGFLVDAVNDLVESENIDLVAMGTLGETNNRQITYGSNTLQVIRYIKCPVLVVPNLYKEIHPKNILFVSDYMLPYKKRELKLVATLAQRITAIITSLHISDFENQSVRQQDNMNFLKFEFKKNETLFITAKGNDITETINKALIDYKVDFLVMVNSRHSYLENLLYTSTIEKIGLHIKIPFLVLQNIQRY